MTDTHDTPAILLVDDEQDILDMLERAIVRAYPGAFVSKAHHALEGEQLLAERPYDIIVSDYRMPGKDGVTFLVEARGHSHASRILLTAYPEQDAAIRAINDARLERFLLKPISMAVFLKAIAEAWDAKKAEGARATAFARSFQGLKAELDAERERRAPAP